MPEIVWENPCCPLCGGDCWSEIDDAPSLTIEGVRATVVQCRGCGLGVTSPRPSAKTIHRFYDDYKPHQGCGLSPARRRRLKNPLNRLKFWESYNPERHGIPRHGQNRLLDFGCGAGEFLELMHLRGWQVLGLDSRREVVERIRAELRLPALTGTLPHAELTPESFDVVTLWHSLEHVHQPVDILREAWRLLVHGGKLLVGVPNIQSGPRRWFGPAWCGWSLPHHLTHFTPQTLQRMVERAGFQTERVQLPRNGSWIRMSAEAACQQPGHRGWQRWLTNRFLARRTANYAHWTGQSDEVVLTAIKP